MNRYAERFFILSEIEAYLYAHTVLMNTKEHIETCKSCQESFYLANKFARIYARESRVKR